MNLQPRKRGRPPLGGLVMSDSQRSMRYRTKKKNKAMKMGKDVPLEIPEFSGDEMNKLTGNARRGCTKTARFLLYYAWLLKRVNRYPGREKESLCALQDYLMNCHQRFLAGEEGKPRKGKKQRWRKAFHLMNGRGQPRKKMREKVGALLLYRLEQQRPRGKKDCYERTAHERAAEKLRVSQCSLSRYGSDQRAKAKAGELLEDINAVFDSVQALREGMRGFLLELATHFEASEQEKEAILTGFGSLNRENWIEKWIATRVLGSENVTKWD